MCRPRPAPLFPCPGPPRGRVAPSGSDGARTRWISRGGGGRCWERCPGAAAARARCVAYVVCILYISCRGPGARWGGAPRPAPRGAAVHVGRVGPHRRTSDSAVDRSVPTLRGNRTLARAWRGHGAGVARAWRGRGAGMSCSPWVPTRVGALVGDVVCTHVDGSCTLQLAVHTKPREASQRHSHCPPPRSWQIPPGPFASQLWGVAQWCTLGAAVEAVGDAVDITKLKEPVPNRQGKGRTHTGFTGGGRTGTGAGQGVHADYYFLGFWSPVPGTWTWGNRTVRAWRGRGADCRHFLWLGVARAQVPGTGAHSDYFLEAVRHLGGTGRWRGRGAGYRLRLGMSGAGVARAWRGRGAGISCSPRTLVKIVATLRRGSHRENREIGGSQGQNFGEIEKRRRRRHRKGKKNREYSLRMAAPQIGKN
eukprot:gene11550-biopygen19894